MRLISTIRNRTTVADNVASAISDKIAAGAYAAGALLPGQRALAVEYDVSPVTIQQAITKLAAKGALRIEKGRGTFVAAAEVLKGIPSAFDSSVSHVPKGAVIGVVTPLVIGRPLEYHRGHGALEIVASFERYISEFDGVTRLFAHDETRAGRTSNLDAAKAAIDAGCDALFVAMYYAHLDALPLKELAEASGIPIVFAGSEPLMEPAISVYYDGVGAGYQAAQHLVKAGADSVAFVAHYKSWWACDRAKGAGMAMSQQANRHIPFHVLPSDLMVDVPGREGAQIETPKHYAAALARSTEWLKAGLPATGIVAANDSCAIGFIDAAAKVGFQPGRDYAIIGFDDEPHARHRNLTSMQPPWESMGREAGRLLIARMTNPQSLTSQVILPSRVVSRLSSRL